MAYLGVACLACSSKRVDSYQAPNGLIIYECDGCGKVWNSNAYKKSSQERSLTAKRKVVPLPFAERGLQLIDQPHHSLAGWLENAHQRRSLLISFANI